MLTITATQATGERLKEALEGGPVLQLITDIVVTPGPNSAKFAFKTRFSSSPLIQIFKYSSGDPTKDVVNQNLVTDNSSQLVGVARKKTHNYRLPRPASWVPDSYPGLDEPLLAPLTQDTHYWFKITADSALADVTPATIIGRLWTSKRDATVNVTDLLVYEYGASDFGSDVDDAINSFAGLFTQSPPIQEYSLYMLIAAYDPIAGVTGSLDQGFQSGVNNGDIPNPFSDQTISAVAAHDFLWLYSYGLGDRGTFKFGGFTGPSVPPDSPPAIPGHDDNGDYGPWSEAVGMTRRLPDDETELAIMQADFQYPMQISFGTGNWITSYVVTAVLGTTLYPPRHAPIIYVSPADALKDGLSGKTASEVAGHKPHKLLANDKGVLAFTTASKLQVLVPGAGHTLWAQSRELKNKSGKTSTPWSKLGEGVAAPITVLTNETDKVDMLASGTDGNIWHAKWDGTTNGAAKVKWHNLDQPINEECVLIRKGNTLDIFVLDDKGAVMHGHLSTEGKTPTWKSLGGNITSELKVLPLADGDIHLFGLGSKGDVWHCELGEASVAKPNWKSLGGLSNVQLIALPHDKEGIVLLAINKKRIVHRKAWKGKSWTPTEHEWKELGLLDSLFGPSSEK